MICVKVLGIVDNTLYFSPFYAAGSIREIPLNEKEKLGLILDGVREYSEKDYIMANQYEMSLDEYRKMIQDDHDAHEAEFLSMQECQQGDFIEDDLGEDPDREAAIAAQIALEQFERDEQEAIEADSKWTKAELEALYGPIDGSL